MDIPIPISSSLKLQKLFKISTVDSSSKITGMVVYFALPYIISVYSLLSVLTGSSAWCQLEGMAVMTKGGHPQRQITRGFKNTSYPASKKKLNTYLKDTFVPCHSYMLHKELIFHLQVKIRYCSDNTNFSERSTMLDKVMRCKIITCPFKLKYLK